MSGSKPDDAPRRARNPKNGIPYREVVSYLNEKAGCKFRASSKATRRLIKARFAEGFTLTDFKTVIDAKATDWASDDRMCAYLRPKTLFAASNFESYLNEVIRIRDGTELEDRFIDAARVLRAEGTERFHGYCEEHGLNVDEVNKWISRN